MRVPSGATVLILGGALFATIRPYEGRLAFVTVREAGSRKHTCWGYDRGLRLHLAVRLSTVLGYHACRGTLLSIHPRVFL